MAATKHKFYKSKFNHTWMESYLVQGVSGDPYKFFFVFLAVRNCLVIMKD